MPVFSCVNDIINPKKRPDKGKKKNNEREINAPSPGVNSNDDFYYIHYNLYLVKTPHFNDMKETRIETFFDKDVLSRKLGNKQFKTDDNLVSQNKHLYYGKRIFAEQIVAPKYKDINFNNFVPLLDRVMMVINDYHARRNKIPQKNITSSLVNVEKVLDEQT